MQPGFKSLISLRCLCPIAKAQIVFGQSQSEQLFMSNVPAGGYLIEKWRQ